MITSSLLFIYILTHKIIELQLLDYKSTTHIKHALTQLQSTIN